MNVAVVGAGSIGTRHQRILRQLGHQVFVISAKSPNAEFRSLAEALESQPFDYVVIASQTSQHFVDFSTLISSNFNGKVLIEKPLFEKPHRLAVHAFSFAAVGYNLRFHPAIVWLKATLPQLGKLSSANIYVGQYLPTWRPNCDYKHSSSARDISGGGALRDLSHELDIAQHLFGDWQHVTALGGKFSDLEIETSDTYSILMHTTNCHAVSIQMNYLDRIKQRYITINGNNGTILVDLIANTARFNDNEVEFDVNTDDTYIAQHRAVVSGDSQNICSLAKAMDVVTTIDAIERSANEQKWISQ